MTCLILVALEFASYIALRYGIMPADRTLVYAPPHVDKNMYKEYQVYRHPVLGWATPVKEERTYSVEAESRPNVFFPSPGDSPCVSVYGDSFTFGSEVEDVDAWANVLSGLLDCKVANFGVGGYGVDQAYLRYELNDADDARINVLAIYPDNILRNLNQYRPFLAGPLSSPTGLKPRFVIEEDQLKLIPPPDFDHDALMRVLQKPQDSLEHETFLPGSKQGPVLLKFPYSYAIFRTVTSPQVRNYLAKKPSYTHFFDLDDPSQAMLIAEKISQLFVKLAAERNHRSLLMLYPTVASFDYYKRTKKIATQGLIDVLKRSDIPHFDLHHNFSEYLGERSYCELITLSCTGHYNAEGNRVVAAAVAEHMRRML